MSGRKKYPAILYLATESLQGWLCMYIINKFSKIVQEYANSSVKNNMKETNSVLH